MADPATIKIELHRIQALIEEAEARLGAHSVKPVLMQRLFELEEARDQLLAKLKKTQD